VGGEEYRVTNVLNRKKATEREKKRKDPFRPRQKERVKGSKKIGPGGGFRGRGGGLVEFEGGSSKRRTNRVIRGSGEQKKENP